jgi:hypothetical protein
VISEVAEFLSFSCSSPKSGKGVVALLKIPLADLDNRPRICSATTPSRRSCSSRSRCSCSIRKIDCRLVSIGINAHRFENREGNSLRLEELSYAYPESPPKKTCRARVGFVCLLGISTKGLLP